MTTIICSDTEMIADRQYICYDIVYEKSKIHKGSLGLMGVSGKAIHFAPLVKWFHEGMDFENPPDIFGEGADWTALYLSNAGEIYTFDSRNFFLDRMEDKFIAIGSGSGYATGALDAGADLYQAFTIASRRDPATGREYDLFTLEPTV